ncbi:MAG: TlpA disulfide reductase family protein [Bacteroidota bacterium]
MKYVLLFITVVIITLSGHSQSVRVIKITELESRLNADTDTTFIVNLWATWCAPCVKELPDFDSIHAAYADKKVKIILVSLDFKEDLHTKLIPFLASKKIKSEVVLMDELNANYFIPKISNEWSGAIPATLIINKQKKINRFFEKKLDYTFLKTQIESIQ